MSTKEGGVRVVHARLHGVMRVSDDLHHWIIAGEHGEKYLKIVKPKPPVLTS